MAKYRDFDDELTYEENDEYEEYEEIGPKKKTKKSKKKKGWIKAVILFLEVVVVGILLLIWYAVDKLNLIKYTPLNEELIFTNEDIDEDTKEVLSGYTNILLLGSDSRQNTSDSLTQLGENHTDAILVASINNDTKEVRIISIYRDTMLEMGPDDKEYNRELSKATEAVFKYGIESAISMVNRNLDLDISKFVMVNWSALIEIVDAVGGVDIEINLMEQRWLNRYLVDTSENTGVSYKEINVIPDDPNMDDDALRADKEKMTTKYMVHMDGIQATAFSRIRFGDGRADYGRTERQRAVISQIVAKAKSMKLSQVNSAITAVCKNIATNMETKEIIDMIPSLMDYKLTMIDGGFPFTKNDQIEYLKDANIYNPVVPVTLEDNVIEFHRILFGADKYKPSATVQRISEEIVKLTGVK